MRRLIALAAVMAAIISPVMAAGQIKANSADAAPIPGNARADEPGRPDVMRDVRRCGCQFGTCPIMCEPSRIKPKPSNPLQTDD
jgi:hypothetical protein